MPARINVELGHADLRDVVAIVNAMALGAALVYAAQSGPDDTLMAQLTERAAQSLTAIGGKRWKKLSQQLERVITHAVRKYRIPHDPDEPLTQTIHFYTSRDSKAVQ